jgi:hypothetical protein
MADGKMNYHLEHNSHEPNSCKLSCSDDQVATSLQSFAYETANMFLQDSELV